MNKEQYLAIVASWKAFINEGKHKKYKKYYDYTDFNTSSEENGKNVSWTTYKDYGYSWESDLTAAHHLIYTLVRKRDVHKRFSEESIKHLLSTLEWQIRHWRNNDSFKGKLLAPFGDNITLDHILNLLNELRQQIYK